MKNTKKLILLVTMVATLTASYVAFAGTAYKARCANHRLDLSSWNGDYKVAENAKKHHKRSHSSHRVDILKKKY